ncbi:MAG TPA: hypothetical protein VGQ91_03090 [Ideonella sp.]|nr:hypothetical protein [Ideonella sp.]
MTNAGQLACQLGHLRQQACALPFTELPAALQESLASRGGDKRRLSFLQGHLKAGSAVSIGDREAIAQRDVVCRIQAAFSHGICVDTAKVGGAIVHAPASK